VRPRPFPFTRTRAHGRIGRSIHHLYTPSDPSGVRPATDHSPIDSELSFARRNLLGIRYMCALSDGVIYVAGHRRPTRCRAPKSPRRPVRPGTIPVWPQVTSHNAALYTYDIDVASNDFSRGQRRVRLAYQPPANSTFLSEQTSQQQPARTSQQYSSLTTNQHQPSAISQPNRLQVCFSSLVVNSVLSLVLLDFKESL
jgi:hypothetical protein